MPSFRRLAFIAALLALCAPRARAQSLPTVDQARTLLATRPDLVAMLRKQIADSGLTPDQIRARLRAAGYPDDLLDAYLPSSPRGGSGSGARDSLTTSLPADDVLDAMAALGLSDSVDTSELRTAIRSRMPRVQARRDSIALANGRSIDSGYVVDDSAGLPSRMSRVDSFGRLVDSRRKNDVSQTAIDSGNVIFGLSVFGGSTTQFDPNLAGPVDANYRVGAGDRLVLIITGDAERAYTLDVTREGFVVIPGVGEVSVANLTMKELDDQLYARLGKVYSGLRRTGGTMHFSINLARLHSNQIYVLGDVEAPGSYRISSAGTALTALYAAGGPTKNGGLRRVEIRRAGKLIDTLDLYDYLLHADGSHDPRLQTGDVVFVPVHGARVRMFGEVVRPGTYELRKGESLADALRAAGGFTPEASRQRVQVSRILPPDQRDTTQRARVVIDVTSSQPDPEAAPAFPLEAGDVIRVFPVSDRIGRRVTVAGNVTMPGAVGFTPGMRISDAIRLAGGLKPDAYLGQVLVSRLRGADSSRVELRTSLRDQTGRASNDMTLQEDDEIRVFSITEFREPTYVAITGAVRRPGRYAYREGLTLRDLVLLAGGLDERASVREAEIARRPNAFDGGRLAVSERVSLDSSYVIGALPNPDHGNGAVMQAGAAREVSLKPYDNVLILARADWARERRVIVTGEVASPGTYTLLTKGDRLSDVLKRAGGLTNTAYPGGIVFYRREGHLGRIGVDLPSVLKDASALDNLLLTDGDSIFLPQFSGIVEVQGAVNAPRGIAWVPGKKLDYYVRAAGGLTRTGVLERAYVTQPDGSVESIHDRFLWPDAVPEPRPGSIVYVTERDPNDKGIDIAKFGVIAQIIGSLVTIVAIIHK